MEEGGIVGELGSLRKTRSYEQNYLRTSLSVGRWDIIAFFGIWLTSCTGMGGDGGKSRT